MTSIVLVICGIALIFIVSHITIKNYYTENNAKWHYVWLFLLYMSGIIVLLDGITVGIGISILMPFIIFEFYIWFVERIYSSSDSYKKISLKKNVFGRIWAIIKRTAAILIWFMFIYLFLEIFLSRGIW